MTISRLLILVRYLYLIQKQFAVVNVHKLHRMKLKERCDGQSMCDKAGSSLLSKVEGFCCFFLNSVTVTNVFRVDLQTTHTRT